MHREFLIYIIVLSSLFPFGGNSVVYAQFSSENDILTYSLPGQTGAALIDDVNHTVDVEVPFGTDVTALVATFTLSAEATAAVGATSQTSGITPNNFTSPVTYDITAGDGTTFQAWLVTVTFAPNTETDILTYSLPGQTGAALIDDVNHTVDVEVPFGTDVTALVATFTLSAEATAAVGATSQTSGITPNNFTSPVTYDITAGDGTTFQAWLVTVTFAPNTETDILTYSLPGQTGAALIDDVNHTVDVEVPFGTDVTALVATFTLSAEATAAVGATSQTSGVTPNNFTSPVTYDITAGDGTTFQAWLVTVTFAPNTETDILTYSLPGQTGAALIDDVNHTVDVEVPFGTDVTALVATFTLSAEATAAVGATSQTSGVTPNNFTSPVTYDITAGDGTTFQAWLVTVTFAPNTETDILTYSLPGQTGAALIDDVNHTVDVEVPFGTDVTALVATFTLSAEATAAVGATSQTSGVTPNNFTSPVTYDITAGDGTTFQAWLVTVTFAPNTETDILTYSLPGQTGAALIDDVNHTVDVEVPFGTDVTALVATFTLSAEATAAVGATSQTSGVTPNNFTSPVTYDITAGDGTTFQAWLVTVTFAPNTETDILTYSLPGQTGAALIDDVNHTVDVEVPFGTDVTALVATFTLSAEATAAVGATSQTSGITPNNFTSPVTYDITAGDGTTFQAWLVTVTFAPNTETDILTYSLPGQTGAALIDDVNHTVDVEVPFGTDVTALVATFALSAEATAAVGATSQTSGITPNNFTSPVTYDITAGDGTTFQAWLVTVTFAPNTETDILTYSLPGQTGAALIDDVNHTVDVEVPFGTDVTALVATFTLSAEATAAVGATSQTSGVTPNNFTSPVTYDITAGDGTTFQAWLVTVTFAPNTETDILTYSLPGQTGAALIDDVNHTVDVEVPFGTDVTALVATFTLSAEATAAVGATSQTSGVTPNNFTSPVTYDITAGDGTTFQAWLVTVTFAPNTETDILTYSLPGQTGAALIDDVNHTVDVEVPFGTDVTALVATFTLSAEATAAVGATSQTSGVTPNNFTSPVTYDITAGDGTTFQAWLVTVTFAPNTETDILTYSLPGQTGAALIDDVNHTVDVEVPFGTDVTALVATFTLSAEATAAVGATSQTSGVTPNNFTSPVTYDITAGDGTTFQAWLVTVTFAPNTETDILTYSLPGQTGAALIDDVNHTVDVEVPFGTDVTAFVATFALSAEATAAVGATSQTSGVTPNNFTSPVTYDITAGDGTTFQAWLVTVTFAPNTETDILTYSVDGYNGTVNSGNHTISILVPYGTDVSDMTATFTLSPEAEARVSGSLQESGVSSLNFSGPITYNIIAGDGITTQDWIVAINFAPNTATDFEFYSFPEQTGDAVINTNSHTIDIQVEYGTSLSNLTASFQLSYGATGYITGTQQTSGLTANNFSTIVVYTVIAEDGLSSQNWTVDVLVEPNFATDILSFSLPGEIGNSIVNSGSHSVVVVMPFGSSISNLIASFTLSTGAEALVNGVSQNSGITSNDFRNELIYTITAENGVDTQDWTIQVSIARNTSTGILLFSFNEISRPSIIDFDNHDVDVLVVYGTDVSNLIPTFTLSVGAEAAIGGITQESGVTSNDFSDPVTYTITAEDGTTMQDWIVTVRIAQNTKADILDYSFAEQKEPATIDNITKEVNILVTYDTDVTDLVATFALSDNATAKVGVDTQSSGVTHNDFTGVVTYVVTSEDESLSNIWNVIVTKANNSSTDILTFSLPGQTKDAKIDTMDHIIDLEVEYGTDLINLIASFTLSPQAVAYIGPVRQESDTSANDYSSAITFTVQAGDGISVQNWIIYVTHSTPNTEADILSYTIPMQVYTKFDTTDNGHHILIYVNEEAELDMLIASFELSDGAYALVDGVMQESGSTVNDFTDTVTYVVMAQDNITRQDWTIKVEYEFDFVYGDRPDEYPVSQTSIIASAKLPLNQSFDEVDFYYRKFEDQGWNPPIQVRGNQEIYEIDITRDMVGNLGMYYYFQAVDSLGNGFALPETEMILHYDTNYPEIPNLRFGETVNQYQIVAVPLALQEKNAEAVFDELGVYNIKKWRLFHHDGISTKEYRNGFTNIDPGLGYWLIAKESIPIHTGEGKTVSLDSPTYAYNIDLDEGWNQIGNPFDMDLNWDDVITDNQNSNIKRVKLFHQDSLTEGSVIPRYRGGFVFLEGRQSITVHVRPSYPYNPRRTPVNENTLNAIDEPSWIAGLKISNGSVTNTLSGIGMHPEAIEGKDRHDDVLMPVPKAIIPFQLAFNHPDEKYDKFSLDVIQTTDQYIWEFEVKNFGSNQTLTISWDNRHFGDNDVNLILNHKGVEKLINMKEVKSYSFNATGTDQFRIIFGDNSFIENELKPRTITFGDGYPNPFTDELSIPFTLPEGGSEYMVNISVYDLTGNLVKQLTNNYYRPGYYTLTWNSLENSRSMQNGIYLIKMSVQSDKINTSLIRKVIRY